MIVLAGLALGLAVLLRGWPLLNALSAALGRGIAWWCSGGLGLQMARYHLGHLRQQQAMADLQARLAAERMRFPAGERAGPAGRRRGVSAAPLLARQYDRCGGPGSR